jgi:ElaB/YqjD/DUF883 family membrane-anchored ribosome-binding protein
MIDIRNISKSEVDRTDGALHVSESLTDQSGFLPAAGEKLHLLKESVAENLSATAGSVHDRSDAAQAYLDQKADSVNEFAHRTIGKVNYLGHKTADALETSSGYLKELDLAEKRQMIKANISRRPEISIAVAAAFGLTIGLLLGRKF